jgi:hypothetical protein
VGARGIEPIFLKIMAEAEMKEVELRNIVVSDAPLVEPPPRIGKLARFRALFRLCGLHPRWTTNLRAIGATRRRIYSGFAGSRFRHPRGRGYARGYLVGLEEEKPRARQVVHENGSGNLLAASFAAENAKQKLEDQERPEAEDLKRVTYLIDRAITGLVQAFTSERPIAEQ